MSVEIDARGLVMPSYDLPKPPSDYDRVDHPMHYTQGNVECIDAIKAAMTSDEFSGYLQGNILKYIWRFRQKNGTEDLKKAKWYLNKLIDERKEQNNG